MNRSTTFIGPPHLGQRQDCDFLALDARNGDVLYRFNTGGAIGGGIVSYEEADKQYVAVMSGKPSPFWVSEIAGSPTVFLFALP